MAPVRIKKRANVDLQNPEYGKALILLIIFPSHMSAYDRGGDAEVGELTNNGEGGQFGCFIFLLATSFLGPEAAQESKHGPKEVAVNMLENHGLILCFAQQEADHGVGLAQAEDQIGLSEDHGFHGGLGFAQRFRELNGIRIIAQL